MLAKTLAAASRFLHVLLLHRRPLLAIASRFSSARFWLIITKVERKIASRETIIVRSP